MLFSNFILWNVLVLQMTPRWRDELKIGWPFIHVLKEGDNFMEFKESKHKILSLWEGRTHYSGAGWALTACGAALWKRSWGSCWTSNWA